MTIEFVEAPPAVGEIVHLNPAEVVVGDNVRLDPRLDKDFLASVRERGVLVPIVGYIGEDGRFVVLYGQRRTLAAVETKRETIPAYVVAGQSDADRLVDQMVENDHRAEISTSERVTAYEQLAALGLSAAQIAKRTSRKRAEVDTALVVAKSELATKAVDRWDFLSLDQAAALAEFEHDTEVVKALTVAAKEGQFDHVLQRARDKREAQRLVDEFAAALAEKGIRVVPEPAYDDKSTIPVTRVRVDGKSVSIEEHASCPGHAAWVDTRLEWVNKATGEPISYGSVYDEDDDEEYEDEEEEPEPVEQVQVRKAVAHFVCTDWKEQGHTDSWASSSTSRPKAAEMSEEERAKAAAERRDVIESNKAWKSAETVRRQWLTTFLTRKTPPKGAGLFLAQTVMDRYNDRLTHMNTPGIRDQLLGGSTVVKTGMSEPRAFVVVLAHALAAYEGQTGIHSWRNPSEGTSRYLRFLQANGYTLSDVEERACLPVE